MRMANFTGRQAAGMGRFAKLATAAAALGILAGCVSSPVPVAVPSAQTIEGLSPSGTVTMTQTFVGGVGVGQGVLTYKGKKIPFKLAGTVIGPGSVSRITVSGDVYKLDSINSFNGVWTESTGPVGLETSGVSNLWMENKAGVVMHLVGKTEGVTLSLGRDEVVIQLTP